MAELVSFSNADIMIAIMQRSMIDSMMIDDASMFRRVFPDDEK